MKEKYKTLTSNRLSNYIIRHFYIYNCYFEYEFDDENKKINVKLKSQTKLNNKQLQELNEYSREYILNDYIEIEIKGEEIQ